MKFGKGVEEKINVSLCFHRFCSGESIEEGFGSILNGKFTVDFGPGFHSIEQFLVKLDGSGKTNSQLQAPNEQFCTARWLHCSIRACVCETWSNKN